MSRRLHITQRRVHGINDAHHARMPTGEAASVGANLGVVRNRNQAKLQIGGLSDQEYADWKSRNPRK